MGSWGLGGLAKVSKWILLVGICLLGTAFSGCADAPIADPIPTSSGLISGTVVEGFPTLHVYKGVPYAASTAGANRWRPPQPRAPWDGVRACTDYGPACPQSTYFGAMSEDCLFLNIWTPAVRRSDRLPVMVWIHGGANIAGSGNLSGQEGRVLARKGAVVVSINYRLGALGFMAHPALSQESEHGASGNYGLLDQQAALKWVRENIFYFGGDPDRIMVFGESAGGINITCQMVSPLSAGLFHRAVAESGIALDVPRLDAMETLGGEIAEKLGATDAAELRAKSWKDVLAAQPGFSVNVDGKATLGPNVDGWVLADQPATLFESGKQHDVPFIAGMNANEATFFMPFVPVYTVAQYKALLQTAFGEFADEVFALYPAATNAEVRPALARVGTVNAIMAARLVMRAMEQKTSNAYYYHFTRVSPLLRLLGLGATHGAEIAYVFGDLNGWYEPVDHALADAMSSAWVRFAATGNPADAWPVYEFSTDRHLEFGDSIQAGERLHETGCDLFEKIWRARRP